MTNDDIVKNTLPWVLARAVESLDGKYALGAIVSEKLGRVIVSIGHDGPDMEMNIARVNAAGEFIVRRCNDV